jgi:uncharacterized protein (TIGR03435 family)
MNGRYRGVGLSMTAIASHLVNYMDTPVSDATGWPGLFTFDLTADISGMPLMARMRSQAGGGAPPQTDAPQLLEVFNRELGVKLVKDRTTIDDFVIERVEPLIEN